jgi:PAS domain S-box-containing protein
MMFKNMKIGSRLALSFGIMLVLIITLMAVSLNSIKRIHQNLDQIVNNENVRTQFANDMSDDVREVSIAVRNILLDKGKAGQELQFKRIDSLRTSYDTKLINYMKLILKDETEILSQIEKINVHMVNTRAANDSVFAFVREGNHEAALDKMMLSARPKVRAWIDAMDVLIALEHKSTLDSYEISDRVYSKVRISSLILGGIAVALAFVIAFLLTISITKPLRIATNLVISRDLTTDTSAYMKGGGELGLMIQSFSKDIRERMKLEEEMRASSLYARNLIEASLDPLVTISAEGKITDVNNTTIKVTGVTREQLVGSDFADYFTEPDKARAGYKQVFSKGIVMDYPLTLRNAEGVTIDVLYNASIYKNEAGVVQGVFAAARDVTELRLKEKELGEYRDQLEDKVKQRTADLSNVLAEVKETVNVLVSSSTQILAATTQVASGTAETATAISETSTTVEEVQQAAKLSAQKAKNVADSAQQVVKVSQNGQKAVDETINGMNQIREQMDSIAQTVVRLSEQSQSIGGIIASVTDIADQSNLLAVNAAIEAAKAGEQGKGFAVVAQEIKNLAEQSKQSTSQVRNILNDVQKATSAAVMATEQGSKAVDAGVKQSALAGEAIRVLSESSNEAVQAAIQIVASSQQQVVGMDQIGVAMQNINQAGTETAVSMVQSEKSAKNLNELGQKLKEMVEKFKE